MYDIVMTLKVCTTTRTVPSMWLLRARLHRSQDRCLKKEVLTTHILSLSFISLFSLLLSFSQSIHYSSLFS